MNRPVPLTCDLVSGNRRLTPPVDVEVMTRNDTNPAGESGTWQYGAETLERAPDRHGMVFGGRRTAADGGADNVDEPGHGRVGGIDDPTPPQDYGDGPEAARDAALDDVDPQDLEPEQHREIVIRRELQSEAEANLWPDSFTDAAIDVMLAYGTGDLKGNSDVDANVEFVGYNDSSSQFEIDLIARGPTAVTDVSNRIVDAGLRFEHIGPSSVTAAFEDNR